MLGCGSDVACLSGRQPLTEGGAGPEAMLGAAVTAADVGAGVWLEMR